MSNDTNNLFLRQQVIDMTRTAIEISGSSSELSDKLAARTRELQFYSNLLTKPMAEIAAKHKVFAETYRLQQEILAEWMVSQKAFKELAIEYGTQLGKTPEEVIQTGLDKEIDVLENKHNPEHNTNVGKSTIIGPHVEALKAKLKKPKAS